MHWFDASTPVLFKGQLYILFVYLIFPYYLVFLKITYFLLKINFILFPNIVPFMIA